MKILFDINHPAHVHFFRNPAKLLIEEGHKIYFTSRKKDVTVQLLNEYRLKHFELSGLGSRGLWSLGKELVTRNIALTRVARRIKPDIMAAVGGPTIAHTGALLNIPSLVFYDTENAKLQNMLTYPLATKVLVPNCYEGWLPKNSMRYMGYHELSYLHPSSFKPNLKTARNNGIQPEKDSIFVRLVSWQANHDIGEEGWSEELLDNFISCYSSRYNILISSEIPLTNKFSKYLYKGKVNAIHHVMAFCRLVIGESATMASEAAMLGVPAIYAAETSRGYINELQSKYNLVSNIPSLKWTDIKKESDRLLNIDVAQLQQKHAQMLSEKIDVAEYVKQRCLDYLPKD